MPRHKRARREFSPDNRFCRNSPSSSASTSACGSESPGYGTSVRNHEKQSSRQYGGNRKQENWHNRQTRPECPGENASRKSGSNSASSNSADACNNELEIPGFYYDKEKKRYFKIAPNHATSTCNYTRDAIAKKDAEIKRQIDIVEIFESGSKLHSQTKKCSTNNNIAVLIHNRRLYGHNKLFIKTTIFRNTVTSLKPVGSKCLFDLHLLDAYENLEHMQIMHVGSNHDEILSLWSIKETWVQRIQRVRITEAVRDQNPTSLSVVARPQLQAVLPWLNKVTDLCWAPLSGTGKHVLYTTMCHMGHQESLALIKSLDPCDTSCSRDYNLGKKATWTCAWNSARCQFGVGSEKCVLVLNVERRTMWEYNTNKSDPLSLTFSHHSGNSLHTGTRRGQIMTFDMRSRSTFPVSTFNHHSSVCSVTELDNDNFLLAADFTGKICLWDVRKRSIILQYEGNVNQYTRLPIHVDELQKIVYTAGEDGYTRFWNLEQGTQLYTIPPPCPVSRETIPCVQLSSRWGNRDGNMGLILGLKNKLYFYGTLPLT